MIDINKALLVAGCSSLLMSTASYAEIEEIIVTAQKRQQAANDVSMSITANTSDDLLNRGITNTFDLPKVVPGLTFQTSNFGTPIFTLRGIGLYESSLGSSPAVAIYVDEVSLPFPIMATGAALDLERVEVLKGPQGTLFGQNSTGGAINHIPAKPTDELNYSFVASYDEHEKLDVSGHVSGPLSDSVRARLALRHVTGGDWQEHNQTNDENGESDLTQARLIIDADVTDKLFVRTTVTAWNDESDVQAPQLDAFTTSVPLDLGLGFNVGLDGFPILDPELQLLSAPPAGNSNEEAGWSLSGYGEIQPKDHQFQQLSFRVEYELNDNMTLTSVTAFSDMEAFLQSDGDGTLSDTISFQIEGDIETFSQELRLSGNTDKTYWLVGLYYDEADVEDALQGFFPYASVGNIPGLTGLPVGRFVSNSSDLIQDLETKAAFANVEFSATDVLTLHAGVRYTESDIDASNCNRDAGINPADFGLTDPPYSPAPLNAFFGLLGLGDPNALQPGDCVSFDTLSGSPAPAITPTEQSLSEDNISWRLGVDYSLGEALVYGNISQGYKQGLFVNLGAATTGQFLPVTEEDVLAYEIGIKTPLFDNTMQLNAATFFYDYTDKQLRSRVLDPVFGLLDNVQNVPKSEVFGVEFDLLAAPIDGLLIKLAATYLASEVTEDYFAFTQESAAGFTNIKGSDIPYTPKLTATADAQYNWAVSDGLEVFVGAGLTYHSEDSATFNDPASFELPSYTLLDLRAGVGSVDGTWQIQVYGLNVTDEQVINSLFDFNDARVRWTSHPTTYGVRFSYNHF